MTDASATAAGLALIQAVEHGGVRCTNESGWCHMQDAKLVREALPAIEAEAAQSPPHQPSKDPGPIGTQVQGSAAPIHKHHWVGPDNAIAVEHCALCTVARHHQHHVHEQRAVSDCPDCIAAAAAFLTGGAAPRAEGDIPEGAIWRPVRMSETLFRALGASGVEWGEPDAEGFYTPSVRLGPGGQRLSRIPVGERVGEEER